MKLKKLAAVAGRKVKIYIEMNLASKIYSSFLLET